MPVSSAAAVRVPVTGHLPKTIAARKWQMNRKLALLAGSILALPAMAVAQPISGLYVGAGAGVNFLNPEPNLGFGLPGGAGTLLSHNGIHFTPGWTGVVSVGYGFGNGLRAEIEGDYRRNQVDYTSGVATGSNGFENKFGGMVNVLYDFNLSMWGMPDWVEPYLGVGVGYMRNSWAGFYAGASPAQVQVNDAVGGFAYQGIVGLAIPVQQVPGLAATVEYRFLDMPFDRKYGAVVAGPGLATPGVLRMGEEINHSVLLGLRYALNAALPPAPPPPAPAPVAAPAPAPSRTYLVFFDWDKADLTDRARQIIAEAAQNSRRVQVTRIEVNGYTDTSGTPQYNQKLSLQRAQNVAAELVRDGVPQEEIAVQGFGETHLLVPTANGVREPQNRRVEIILK
jgi:OOP family OmpA-OmpF porin